jgi:hypothetical protein
MVYNPNANWTAAIAKSDQQPVWFVKIAGLTTEEYATGVVKSPVVTKKNYLQTPRTVGQKLDQLKGTQTLQLSNLEIVDSGDDFTALIKAGSVIDPFANRKVTLYQGDTELAEADYAIVMVGRILDISLLEDGLTYQLKIGDLKRFEFQEIMTGADAGGDRAGTTLTADVAAQSTAFSVADVTGIVAGQKIHLGPSSDVTDSGDEDLATVAQVSGLTVRVETAITSAYASGDSVRWASVLLEGNPIDIIYSVLTGDYTDATFGLDKAEGFPTGLGMAASDIDTAFLQKERDRMIPGVKLKFEFLQPLRGVKFLESQIYRLWGFPYITHDGKFRFRLYRPTFPDDAPNLGALTKADVSRWTWRRDLKLHINQVILGVDYNEATSRAALQVATDDTADQTATELVSTLKELNSGLSDSPTFRGTALATVKGHALFNRFLGSPTVIGLTVSHTKRAVELGEYLELTHEDIPNSGDGTRGYTDKRMQVIEVADAPEAASVRLALQDTMWIRPAWIQASPGAPEYTGATDDQKEYAFISPAAGADFADGTSPYGII